MFVWSMFTVSFLQVLAVPVIIGGFYMMITDRTAQTAFYVNQLGGSSYLYQNLFWFFGHPEVYILALPGFGVVSEILPVFARKPLFGYKVGAAGMFGVALLSFFVWQHHLFNSGINPDMRPLFMLTTELISIPTGFIYLVAMGTLWKAKIRFSVPMLFCPGGSILVFVINFVWSTVIVREREVGNPWNSRGLEWQVASPPPPGNFDKIPVVLSGPYDYGVKDAQPVADLNPPTGVLSAAIAQSTTARAEA